MSSTNASLSSPASNPQIASDSILKFFLIGGLSGATASSVVHPVDTLKARCQTLNEVQGIQGNRRIVNPISLARQILAKEGIRSFYKGIDSSIFRQLTYASGRLGVYKSLYDWTIKKEGKVTFGEKIVYSLFSGLIGACIGNPADLTMVRRQTDLSLPIENRRNYGNVFQSLFRVAKDEGLFALWRGTPFTILRVMALTCGQMTTFDEVKERTRKYRNKPDDIYNRVAAAIVSGFISSSTALPFDNVKVKFQKMIKNPDGSWPYLSLRDTIIKTFRREGIPGFWSGFPAFYMLVGPHTLITLIVQDYLHIAYDSYRANKLY